MIRIVHLVTDLDVGGAEKMLVRLVGRMNHRRFENHVISMVPGGTLASTIDASGIPVSSLSMRRGWPDPTALVRLVAILRRIRPDILQTWLYHADVLGTLAARLAKIPTLLWNVRASDIDMNHYRRLSRVTRLVATRLSPRPAAIIVNSAAGRRAHEQLGYRPRRWVHVPNGIDCREFAPDPAARSWLRRSLGVPPSAVLVGLVARFHPMKDHRMFIRAAGILCRHQPDVHVVLAGAGVDASNGELRRMLAAEGIENRTALLGSRDDVARVDAALDVAVMASSGGEGFPTAIAEAMACGVPGVVTDVGDARRLVEGTGRVVAAGDARALADACRELVEASPADRQALGRAARVRILTQYSLATIVRAYQRLYASFAST